MTTKKCIVVDLDNTLWGGIVGEDGIAGLALSTQGAGASFIAFQQALLDLNDRGVLLATNSRNNPDEALEVIRSHPNMILKERHFAAHRINWADKAQNMVELAKELNIGLDSMVFLDDDPTNRALVRAMAPEVEVPELPASPSEYARFLHSLPYFPQEAITDEDKMRGNLYVTERLRKEAEKAFTSRESFLADLGLELTVFVDDASSAARLAQLTEKTNQFNTNKAPLSEEQVKDLVDDPSHRVFYGRLTDRFGDYGITNVALVEHAGDSWNIYAYLMSCRVFGRGVEDAFLAAVAQHLQEAGAKELSLTFVKTDKNKPAEDFVQKVFAAGAVPIASITTNPSWIRTTYGTL